MPKCSVSWNSLLDAVQYPPERDVVASCAELEHHLYLSTCRYMFNPYSHLYPYDTINPTNAIGKDTRPGMPSLVDANSPMFICTTGFDYNGGDSITITLHDPACATGQPPTAITLHGNTAPTKHPSAQLYNSSSN